MTGAGYFLKGVVTILNVVSILDVILNVLCVVSTRMHIKSTEIRKTKHHASLFLRS